MLRYLRKTFRLWWQKPLPTENMHDDREVTFLELFYDLVYVVIFAEVAHYLGHHLSWTGLAQFAFMFVFVLWAWINGMFYHSLHGTNDISMRVFTFAQMLLIGALTVFIGDIFKDGASGFAITFGLFQLLFAALWFRTGYHDPKHRAASTPFSILYVISAAALFYSVTVDSPTNYWIWGSVVGTGMLMPFLTYIRPAARSAAIESSRHSLDAVERFGLITIVALGEVIVSSVNGVNELKEFTFRNGSIGGLGILIAIGIWWLYFDFISRRVPKKGFWNNQLFTYLHIPIIMSITATGAVLREMVVHNDYPLEDTARWIFTAVAGTGVVAIALTLKLVKQNTPAIQKFVDKASNIMLACGLLIVALGASSLGYIALLSSVFAILLIPIAYGVGTWIRNRAREERLRATSGS